MTCICREQYLSLALAGQHCFRKCHRAVNMLRINHNLVFAVFQSPAHTVCETETPSRLVVTQDIWHGVGHVRQAVKMFVQFLPADFPAERNGVVDYVQVIIAYIEYALPRRSNDIGFADYPFLGHDPIKHLSTGWYFHSFKRKNLAQDVMGPADTFTGYAPEQRPEPIEITRNVLRRFTLNVV